MNKFNRFEFDTDFFELTSNPPVPGPDGTPQPPAPKLPKNVQEAKDQGYEEGYAAARAELETAMATELEGLQHALTSTLQNLETSMTTWQDEHLTQLLSLMRISLHRILGHAAANYPDQLLETHLRSALADIRTHEDLTLRIAPAARQYHEKLGLSHAAINGIPMHIVADGSLAPTDALIEWSHGGLETRLLHHIEALDTLLRAAGAHNVTIPEVPMPVSPPSASPVPPPAPLPPTIQPTSVQPPSPPSGVPEAAAAVRSRAAELLGDDELVDALK